MRPVVRSLILAASLAAAALPSGLAVLPVAADCGSDGIRWPTSPGAVRGLTFIGTVLDEAPSTPRHGATMRFAVDQLLDGVAGPEVIVVPWCVGTRFQAGERYLVSTSDVLPVPGSSPSPGDGRATFTDGASVAWRLHDDGKAVLLGYGEDSLRNAPGWLRHAVSRDQAVAAILPDPASPVPAVTDTVADGTFRLTIATDRASYSTTEAIPVSAVLEYLGTERAAITGSGSGLVGFGVEQLDGPVDSGPGWRLDCRYEVWEPGMVRFVPFRKSGGYASDDPMAPFWIAYFNDADLVLPAGHYRVTAVGSYGIEQCGGGMALTAEVRIEVVEGSDAASPAPGSTP